jgi:hypothetical protein
VNSRNTDHFFVLFILLLLLCMTATIAPTSAPVRRKRSYTPQGSIGKLLTKAQALQYEIQRLEAELKPIRAELLAAMQSRGLTALEIPGFSASLRTRNHWTYTQATQDAAAALQISQKWEQRRGIATNAPTTYIALTTPSTPESDS